MEKKKENKISVHRLWCTKTKDIKCIGEYGRPGCLVLYLFFSFVTFLQGFIFNNKQQSQTQMTDVIIVNFDSLPRYPMYIF